MDSATEGLMLFMGLLLATFPRPPTGGFHCGAFASDTIQTYPEPNNQVDKSQKKLKLTKTRHLLLLLAYYPSRGTDQNRRVGESNHNECYFQNRTQQILETSMALGTVGICVFI